MTKPVIIIGGGGHAYSAIDSLQAAGIEILGYTDSSSSPAPAPILNIPYLGTDAILTDYNSNEINICCAIIGSPKNQLRAPICEKLAQEGYTFQSVIHPKAIIGASVTIQAGAQIMAGAVIQAAVEIKQNAVVNTAASVDHQSIIEEYAHIAPGAILAGSVRVGRSAYIGLGAKILPGVTIGEGAIVGAGAVVTQSVPPRQLVKGIPAR